MSFFPGRDINDGPASRHMNLTSERLQNIASHAAVVAAHLRALESEIAPQGVTPLLSVEREAVQNSRSFNPQIFNPISEMQRLWNINNSNTLKTNSHNLFVVSQSCTNPTITDAPTKTSKKSTTKGAMEKAYGEGLSTSASKDLSYLNRMREDDKAKKRRVRNQTKMLLSQLDGLLPAPTSGKPRGVLEIIASASMLLKHQARRGASNPLVKYCDILLSVRR